PCAPITGLEQAHRPPRGLAPCRRAPLAVPDPHLPEDLLAGPERPPAIGHVELLVRFDAPAVPHLAAVATQGLERRGHEDLPRALAQPRTSIAAQLPGEAGRCRVDAERIHH